LIHGLPQIDSPPILKGRELVVPVYGGQHSPGRSKINIEGD